ncbi:hypothetical protein ACP70R_039327 [Stipagrostis hirtigluma subsp. patula]
MNQQEMLRLAALLLLLALAPPAAAGAAAPTAAPPPRGPAASCPYDFTTAAKMIPSECHANATVGKAATGLLLVRVRRLHLRRRRPRQPHRRGLPPARARRRVLRRLRRHAALPRATSPRGSRPCQLATVDAVRAMAPRALPNATRLCAAPGSRRAPSVAPNTPGCSECREAVIATTYEMLASAQTKEFVPCGMAATLAVWSRAPPPLKRFRAYALCMLQVLENVNTLGTSDFVPSPPAPPPPPASSPILLSPPPAASRSSSSRSTVRIAAGSAVAGVAAILAIASAAVTGDDDSDEDDESLATLPPLPREGLYIFTKEELMQATNGYDKKLLLGTGGAGKVYLGHLPSGQRVAIKKIYRAKKVSEFYARGGRARQAAAPAASPRSSATASAGAAATTRWSAVAPPAGGGGGHGRRARVPARFPGGAVVHRDVKPTNVLLSESGAAKLADFGVSRIVPEGGTHLSTEVRGTRGYVDPESFSAGHVSEAADVYSFGVVLLELATGMPAVVPTPGPAVEAMVDRRLGPEWDRPTVRAVFAVACRCVRPYKNERPEIAEVLAVLKAVLADYDARVSNDGGVMSPDAELSEGTASSLRRDARPGVYAVDDVVHGQHRGGCQRHHCREWHSVAVRTLFEHLKVGPVTPSRTEPHVGIKMLKRAKLPN